MAKSRVAERSPTGSLQSTPAGDRAAGTRGPTAPGSKDHLKGEWIQEPELGLDLRGKVPVEAPEGTGAQLGPGDLLAGVGPVLSRREKRGWGTWVWAAAQHKAGHLVGEP